MSQLLPMSRQSKSRHTGAAFTLTLPVVGSVLVLTVLFMANVPLIQEQ